MAQANSRYSHFPESAANFIVDALLHDIFEHCSSQDVEVCKAGLCSTLAGNVHQTHPEPYESPRAITSHLGMGQQVYAMSCSSRACKAMNTAEQQESMALLVSMLELEPDWQRQLIIVSEMQIFWRAVADPWDTYAATGKQLEHMLAAALHPKVRSQLRRLL